MDAFRAQKSKACLAVGWFWLLAFSCCQLAGCSSDQERAPSTSIGEGFSGTPKEALTSLPRSSAAVLGGVVYRKELQGEPSAVADIRYATGVSPVCTFEIVEGTSLVASNSHLVECGSLASERMLDVEVDGTTSNLKLLQQLAKGTNSYFLSRRATGLWVVTKAEFVHPRDNAETGEVEVVRETADLTNRPVEVDKYSAESIRPRIVETLVQ